MKKIGLGFKIMVFTFLLVVTTAVILIYFSYRTSYSDLEKAIGQRLEDIAATGELMINGDRHDQIKTNEDENTEAFKKLQKILRDIKKRNNINLLIISAIILVVGILLSFLLSRRMVKNLRYLSDITEKISTGMMERSINIKSKDEVGELAESLERMRISLKMAMEMIEKEQEDEDEN